MVPNEYVLAQESEAVSNSQQPPSIVPTRIESRELSSVGREMTEAIRRRIEPSLYERLREEMRIG